MKYAMIPALALTLQGCNINTGPLPTEEWLQGSWVAVEEGCQSDAGIFFYNKGVVQALETEGIWTLNKDLLKITITNSAADAETESTNSVSESVLELSDVSPHSFTAKYENETVVKYKRCQTAEELNKKNVVQKIIWEWTGGYQSDNIFIRGLCRESSDNLQEYLNTGWKIKSTAPFERYVNNGKCQGRDIVLEREE